MTPSSIQFAAVTVPVDSIEDNRTKPAKPQDKGVPNADRVELSIRVQESSLSGESDASDAASSSTATATAHVQRQTAEQLAAARARAAAAAPEDKVDLNSTARARMLRGEGESIPEIADDLEVSPKTVNEYLEITPEPPPPSPPVQMLPAQPAPAASATTGAP